MLKFQIIREDVSCSHTVEPLTEFTFYAGEKVTLALQILNGYNNQAFMVQDGFEVMVRFDTADSESPIVKQARKDSVNNSIIYVDLEVEDTNSIISGTIYLRVVEMDDSEAEVIEGPFADVITYTSSTGIVSVNDAVDLSNIVVGDIFIDASNARFFILGSIDNTVGSKQFAIATSQTVDASVGASIERSSNIRKAQLKRSLSKVRLSGCSS